MHIRAPEKQFFKFVVPAMASQLLMGFFIIVDGFFIGQSIGDTGLAAINILWPIAALIMATGLGIGTGGSVLMSTALGAKDHAKAALARGNTLLCLGIATLLLTLVLGAGYPWLLHALGARGVLAQPATEYVVIIVLACGLQVFNSGLNPLLRGVGKTVAAMVIMVAGLLSNIFLDWLFIMHWGWGMKGAALATVTAQGVSALAALLCLILQRQMPFARTHFRPQIALCTKLCRVGISPFGLSMSASILIMLNNWQCIRYGSTQAVAVYAILSYVLGAVQPLMSGVGDGIQPLVSYCRGARNGAAMQRLLFRALATVLGTSFVLGAGVFLLRAEMPFWFGASAQTAAVSAHALTISLVSFPLWGTVRLFSSYFYATGENKAALFLIFCDPLMISPLFLYLLPLFWGVDGIWAALPVTQAALCAFLGFFLLYKKQRTPLAA